MCGPAPLRGLEGHASIFGMNRIEEVRNFTARDNPFGGGALDFLVKYWFLLICGRKAGTAGLNHNSPEIRVASVVVMVYAAAADT